VFDSGDGSEQFPSKQKISTTSEHPLGEVCPLPKKILFVDDVDAR
jgi:hypothetical protein